jgi:hypothetical protein
MIHYDKSIIYKICCQDLTVTEIYIGSTTNFRLRKSHHKNLCNNILHNGQKKLYNFMRDRGGWENWSMVQVEQYKAVDKRDLHQRERFWIEELDSKLNINIPSRTNEEYYIDNREKISAKQKIYHHKNRETILARNKIYQIKNKDTIKIKQKIYRDKNKETISEKSKINYDKNRKTILEKKKIYQIENRETILSNQKIYWSKKTKCGCGSIYSACFKSVIKKHELTKKHQEWVNNSKE